MRSVGDAVSAGMAQRTMRMNNSLGNDQIVTDMFELENAVELETAKAARCMRRRTSVDEPSLSIGQTVSAER